MSKEGVSFKNRDRFIQLGIAISTLRKLRGMSHHLLTATINGACEVFIRRYNCKVGRHFDEETGLNLYTL